MATNRFPIVWSSTVMATQKSLEEQAKKELLTCAIWRHVQTGAWHLCKINADQDWQTTIWQAMGYMNVVDQRDQIFVYASGTQIATLKGMC